MPRSWIMVRIVSAVRLSRTLTSFPWETCFPSPVGFLCLSSVPVETALPSADYYGSSVALGLAPRRQSRALLLPYVVAWGRWPVRSVVRVHYPLSCPRRWVGPRSRHTQGPASSSGALAMGLVGTDWELDFNQSRFHHTMQVLQVCDVCAFSALPALPPCSGPFCLFRLR